MRSTPLVVLATFAALTLVGVTGIGRATILDDGRGAELCLGGMAASLPRSAAVHL